MNSSFQGGVNIAMKIPKADYEATVAFYRDTLGLSVEERPIQHATVTRTHRVLFGPNTLWLDCIDNYAHSELWLELNTDDVEQARSFLQSRGTGTCDEIEVLPPGMHWIKDPAGTVMILKTKEKTPS